MQQQLDGRVLWVLLQEDLLTLTDHRLEVEDLSVAQTATGRQLHLRVADSCALRLGGDASLLLRRNLDLDLDRF